MRFFDASALVKRYIRERHTRRVRALLERGDNAVCRLSEVEVVSAVTRLARDDALSVRQRDAIVRAVVADLSALVVVEITPAVAATARRLLLQHALRAGDSIQLAAALVLQESIGEPLEQFVAYDDRLLTAARAEQLVVD